MMAWFLAKDWRTWLSHILMAGLDGTVAALVLQGALAGAGHTVPWLVLLQAGVLLAVLGYWKREGEQVIEQAKVEGMAVVHAHAVDHFMDMAAPFAAFVLWVALT